MARGRNQLRIALVATVAIVATLGFAPPAGVAAPGPEATAARYCGKANIGFTTANVRARNVRCAAARWFVRSSARVKRNCTEANRFCRVTHYKGYRCVKGGSEIVVKVTCRKGRKVISETHGD